MSLCLQVKWCFEFNAKVIIANMLTMTAGGHILLPLSKCNLSQNQLFSSSSYCFIVSLSWVLLKWLWSFLPVNIFNDKLKFDYHPESAASLGFMELDSEIKLVVFAVRTTTLLFWFPDCSQVSLLDTAGSRFHRKGSNNPLQTRSSTANSRQKWSRLASAHKGESSS